MGLLIFLWDQTNKAGTLKKDESPIWPLVEGNILSFHNCSCDSWSLKPRTNGGLSATVILHQLGPLTGMFVWETTPALRVAIVGNQKTTVMEKPRDSETWLPTAVTGSTGCFCRSQVGSGNLDTVKEPEAARKRSETSTHLAHRVRILVGLGNLAKGFQGISEAKESTHFAMFEHLSLRLDLKFLNPNTPEPLLLSYAAFFFVFFRSRASGFLSAR